MLFPLGTRFYGRARRGPNYASLGVCRLGAGELAGLRTFTARRIGPGLGVTLIQDGGDDLELPCTAARAALHIDVKHALEQSRPVDASRPGLQSVDFALAGAGGEDARIVPGWGESAQTAPEETLDQCTDW